MKRKEKKPMTPVKLLSLGYIITILIGTILLVLPYSSKNGEFTGVIDALFTATSATCVTGLIPFDTFHHWSFFGQIVIICLIQIGGLGFMTIITLIFMLFRKNIGIYNRTVLMQSAGSYNISEVTKLIKRILIGTILFEGIGAAILANEFYKLGDPKNTAIYKGIFHSISAFCNAGFDILGADPAGASLTGIVDQPVILITLMALIVIGASGFVVWSDIIDNKFKFKKYQLHTKIVIVFNTLLIIIPAGLFFLFEFTTLGQNGHFSDLNLSLTDKILNSFFLSVSPRTAGFNAVDLNCLTSAGTLLTIILMFIGGNSGSTAGGLKVTTFIIIICNLISQARGSEHIVLFKRRVDSKIVKQASALFIAYLSIIVVSTLVISAVEEGFKFEQILFEITSALCTVGATTGLSASGTIFTKIVLIFLMYAGRLGALVLFSVFIKKKKEYILEEPKGKLLVG